MIEYPSPQPSPTRGEGALTHQHDKRDRYKKYVIRLPLYFICLLVFSHGVYKIYEYLQPSPFVDAQIVTVQGMIVDIPHALPYGVSFMLKTPAGLLKLTWYQKNQRLIPGQIWQMHIKLKALPYYANPGEFNYRQYLHQENIQGMGYVLNDSQNHLLETHSYNAAIDYLRYFWYQKLLNATADLQEKSILIALVLGDKTLLNAVDWQSFERTGTSYFMVISGLHIVLFAALGGLGARYLWALFPRLTLYIPAPVVGLSVGLILGMIYGALAGALVPTQRAVSMLLLTGVAKLRYRHRSSLNALGIAFLVMIAWNPLVILSVAFWLSFIAVFFLIFCFSGRLRKLKIWQEWLWPQWLMFWALLPIMIYTFHQFSPISLFTNLIAMPIMMLGVIPAALSGAFFIWLCPSLGMLCLKLSNGLMLQLLFVLHYAAFKLWWGTWLPHISFINLIFGLMGAVMLFLPKGMPGRYLGWLMLIPVLMPIPEKQIAGEVHVTTLNTQNGPLEIITSQHHVIMIQNIRHMRAAHNDLKHIVAAYCLHEGIKKIDLWVVNLSGNYHQLLTLMKDLPSLSIQKIASNHRFTIYDSRVLACAKPSAWRWDQIDWTLKQENKTCTLHFTQAAALNNEK